MRDDIIFDREFCPRLDGFVKHSIHSWDHDAPTNLECKGFEILRSLFLNFHVKSYKIGAI